MTTKKTLEEIKKEIKETEERLTSIRRDIRSPLEADSSEQAIQLENRGVLMELEKVESIKLTRLNQELESAKHAH